METPEKEKYRPYDTPYYNHRMQTYNTSFEESDGTHPVPTIIIGITYNKAGKHKEKSTAK